MNYLRLPIAIAFLLPINPSLMQEAKSFPSLGVSEPLRKICQDKAARGRNEFDSKLTYNSCLKTINGKFNAKLKEVMPEVHEQCSENNLKEYLKSYTKDWKGNVIYDLRLKESISYRDRDNINYQRAIHRSIHRSTRTKFIHLSQLRWSEIKVIPSRRECKKSIKRYYSLNPKYMRTQKRSYGKTWHGSIRPFFEPVETIYK